MPHLADKQQEAGENDLSDRSIFLAGSVAEETKRRYVAEAKLFWKWARQTGGQCENYRDLDELLTDSIMWMYYENSKRGQRQNAICRKAGVEMLLMIPSGNLPGAARALRAWDKIVPGHSPPPLTWDLTMVIAGEMRRRGYRRLACGILIAFCGYLRIGELLALEPSQVDVSFPIGLRVDGKTGRNQFVAIKNKLALSALTWLVSTTSGSLVGVNYSTMRKVFTETLTTLGLSGYGFTLHSLRHGGATHDFIGGKHLSHIALLGRWESKKSLRRYIQSGRASLVGLQLPDHVKNQITLIHLNQSVVLALPV
eukprot:Lithocolla_globosa_v1_NODE_1892_length_2270_cov_26.995485.p1 type:complete len:311 gc:universal NODE_1892_length_2270_cov_26.995485:1263-331(-)